MMGHSQPAKDFFGELWIGDKQFAAHSPDSAQIVDLKKNIMLLVNHKTKTYIEVALPFDFASLIPPQFASMMQGMMKMTVTVTPTGRKKNIGQWGCDEYEADMNMMMMPMKMKIFATTDVPFDLNDYMENVYGHFLKAQMRLDADSAREMAKIKGFWIASETDMEIMGSTIKSTMGVLEISKKQAPADVYSAPAGYAKKDKFSMEDLSGR